MKTLNLLLVALISLGFANSLSAHCQVPCGIFADELKFGELEQHVETIDKAGRLVRELSAKEALSAQDRQQIIRWTQTKESHAQTIIQEVADYFLAQRVKTDAAHYEEKLVLLHHMIVFSMKAKQSVEHAPVATLGQKIAEFKGLYLDHGHVH